MHLPPPLPAQMPLPGALLCPQVRMPACPVLLKRSFSSGLWLRHHFLQEASLAVLTRFSAPADVSHPPSLDC